MMKITVNGQATMLEGPEIGLVKVLESMGIDTGIGGIAIALNMSVVRKGEWERTVVREGDEIEIITARQGG